MNKDNAANDDRLSKKAVQEATADTLSIIRNCCGKCRERNQSSPEACRNDADGRTTAAIDNDPLTAVKQSILPSVKHTL